MNANQQKRFAELSAQYNVTEPHPIDESPVLTGYVGYQGGKAPTWFIMNPDGTRTFLGRNKVEALACLERMECEHDTAMADSHVKTTHTPAQHRADCATNLASATHAPLVMPTSTLAVVANTSGMSCDQKCAPPTAKTPVISTYRVEYWVTERTNRARLRLIQRVPQPTQQASDWPPVLLSAQAGSPGMPRLDGLPTANPPQATLPPDAPGAAPNVPLGVTGFLQS